MDATSTLLSRLHNVKQTGAHSWSAGCPCCQSKRGRPIAISERDDLILMNPFCGCETGAVLSALGLTLSDLYDRPMEHSARPARTRIAASELLDLVAFELAAAGMLLSAVVEGRAISEVAWARLAKASQRINLARSYAHG